MSTQSTSAERAAERIRAAMYPPEVDGQVILSIKTMAKIIAEENTAERAAEKDVLTPDWLNQIATQLDGLTDGPWFVVPGSNGDDAYIAFGTPGDLSETYDLYENYNLNDYQFMSAARQNIPKLLSHITAELEAWEQRDQQLVEALKLSNDWIVARLSGDESFPVYALEVLEKGAAALTPPTGDTP